MSSLQPITLYAHPGPNPWKVALLLSELNIPYTSKVYTTPELKQPDFLAINNNGLSPVIDDPNTGLRLAESGAIMDYILSQYDKDHKISFADLQDKWLVNQWREFQNTAQGPILQRIFRYTRTEPNPTARQGAIKEFRHVLEILENELKDKEWLVGGKYSAADLSFVAFHRAIPFIFGDDAPDIGKDYPHVDRWFKKMSEREMVVKVNGERDEAMKRITLPGKMDKLTIDDPSRGAD